MSGWYLLVSDPSPVLLHPTVLLFLGLLTFLNFLYVLCALTDLFCISSPENCPTEVSLDNIASLVFLPTAPILLL